jgi:hypothetical protein
MSNEDPHADTQAGARTEYDRFEEFYKEWERLRGVATSELSRGGQGDFLRCFLEAFARADSANAKLLLLPMQLLEKKYKLEDYFLMLQKHPTLDRSSGEPGLT